MKDESNDNKCLQIYKSNTILYLLINWDNNYLSKLIIRFKTVLRYDNLDTSTSLFVKS